VRRWKRYYKISPSTSQEETKHTLYGLLKIARGTSFTISAWDNSPEAIHRPLYIRHLTKNQFELDPPLDEGSPEFNRYKKEVLRWEHYATLGIYSALSVILHPRNRKTWSFTGISTMIEEGNPEDRSLEGQKQFLKERPANISKYARINKPPPQEMLIDQKRIAKRLRKYVTKHVYNPEPLITAITLSSTTVPLDYNTYDIHEYNDMMDCFYFKVVIFPEVALRHKEAIKQVLDEWEPIIGDGFNFTLVPELFGGAARAIRLIALGKVLGFWDLITPYDLTSDEKVLEVIRARPGYQITTTGYTA
jgi:hypothetical protein